MRMRQEKNTQILVLNPSLLFIRVSRLHCVEEWIFPDGARNISVQNDYGCLPSFVSIGYRVMKLTADLYLLPKLRMYSGITLLPPYAFMIRCWIKNSDRFSNMKVSVMRQYRYTNCTRNLERAACRYRFLSQTPHLNTPDPCMSRNSPVPEKVVLIID